MDFLSSPPPNILLLTTILLISHFPIYGFALRGASHIITDKGFLRDCAFDLGDYTFNLCPLAGTATATIAKSSRDYQQIDRVEGPCSGNRVYEIALGGMLTESSRLPTSDLACDSDTWVCMTDEMFVEIEGEEGRSGNGLRRNPKALVTPVARRKRTSTHHSKILASIVVKGAGSIEGVSPLQLSLDGGEAEGRPQSAEIEMVCDFGVDSYLEFINERDGVHSFRWTTQHGCPTNIKSMYTQPLRLSTAADGADDEQEENKGDDELLPQGMSTARRWMAIILIFVVTSILCSSLFMASPYTRRIAKETTQSLFYSTVPILSAAAIKARPLGRSILSLSPKSFLCGVNKPFRQGSNQLVRWAEEDMMLREGDDDMMVNGGSRNFDEENWHGAEFGEYIPLTANPKHGRGRDVKSYGATPDVETFEQRGLIGGIGRLFR